VLLPLLSYKSKEDLRFINRILENRRHQAISDVGHKNSIALTHNCPERKRQNLVEFEIEDKVRDERGLSRWLLESLVGVRVFPVFIIAV
jgi:hypothetical protein